MRKVLRRLASLLGDLTPAMFPWPGMDTAPGIGATISPGGQYKYIDMGTSMMVSLPTRLLERLEQAQQAQTLIMEADITIIPLLTSGGEAQIPLVNRISAAHYDRGCQLNKDYQLDLARRAAKQNPAATRLTSRS